jgi:hypothetical protein
VPMKPMGAVGAASGSAGSLTFFVLRNLFILREVVVVV